MIKGQSQSFNVYPTWSSVYQGKEMFVQMTGNGVAWFGQTPNGSGDCEINEVSIVQGFSAYQYSSETVVLSGLPNPARVFNAILPSLKCYYYDGKLCGK